MPNNAMTKECPMPNGAERIVHVPARPFMVPDSGSDVRLTVPEGNGLVAVNGGQPWPGCTNLLLPFP